MRIRRADQMNRASAILFAHFFVMVTFNVSVMAKTGCFLIIVLQGSAGEGAIKTLIALYVF